VIGGLSFATFATLVFVPAMFAVMSRHRDRAPNQHPV
jgi:multidrug efflux pump subunit AcrB